MERTEHKTHNTRHVCLAHVTILSSIHHNGECADAMLMGHGNVHSTRRRPVLPCVAYNALGLTVVLNARVSYGIALCFVRCSAQCGAAIAWLTLCSTQCTSPERQGLVRYVLRAAHTSVHLGLLCVFLHVPIACALLLCQQVSETQLGCRV